MPAELKHVYLLRSGRSPHLVLVLAAKSEEFQSTEPDLGRDIGGCVNAQHGPEVDS